MARRSLEQLRKGWANAFALDDTPLTAEERELLQRITAAIVKRQMAMPAILFLNSISPLNSLASQAMVFLRQFLVGVISPADYDRLTAILDRRQGIPELIRTLEVAEAAGKDRSS